jgi:hypothetical protein
MSWETFKQNVLRVLDNPQSIADVDLVAKTFATEYDAAVKRGGDTQNLIPVKKGNVAGMQQSFKLALEKGLTSNEPYDLVEEMGKGVIDYWSTATLTEQIPITPAEGSAQKVGVIQNIVVDAGVWKSII